MSRPIIDPFDGTRVIIGQAAEPNFGIEVGPSTLKNVHRPDQCAGRHCVIHNPSEHHMRDWPLRWRDDQSEMERVCPHRIGHPDPDDAAYQISRDPDWAAVHTCDGCCRPPAS